MSTPDDTTAALAALTEEVRRLQDSVAAAVGDRRDTSELLEEARRVAQERAGEIRELQRALSAANRQLEAATKERGALEERIAYQLAELERLTGEAD